MLDVVEDVVLVVVHEPSTIEPVALLIHLGLPLIHALVVPDGQINVPGGQQVGLVPSQNGPMFVQAPLELEELLELLEEVVGVQLPGTGNDPPL